MKWTSVTAIVGAVAVLGSCSPPAAEEPAATDSATAGPQFERGPRIQPGTDMGLYSPGQHDLYDGHFILSAGAIYQIGTLNDQSPWNHMGDDGSTVRAVGGTAEIDVDEINNTGSFRAELDLPEGRYVITLEEIREFAFMVTQGMRNRETLATNHSSPGSATGAGAVNPAMQQLDFYIRSPEENAANQPGRAVFDHFFAMEVTWK